MPFLLPLLFVGGMGGGYFLGVKTDKIITTIVIGGIAYIYIKSKSK